MYCRNCGKENMDGASFCTKCGSALSEKTENVIIEDARIEDARIENAKIDKVNGKNKGIIIGIILAFVIIIALIVAYFIATNSDKNYFNDTDNESTSFKNNEYEDEYEYENSDTEEDDKKASPPETNPKTVMDLFDGERRIWFYVDYHTPAHDAPISKVFVVENGNIVEAYYKFQSSYTEQQTMLPKVYGELYTLGDFANMSGDEILDLIRENYADMSETINYTFDSDDYTIPGQALPYAITYGGELDNSGNNIEREVIYLAENETFYSYKGTYSTGKPFAFYIDDFIQPTTVKDTEYVGLKQGGTEELLITENTFDSFSIKNDDVDGAVKTW